MAWRCKKETGILLHYYISWKDLKFYIKKEDNWTTLWKNTSIAFPFTSPDLLTSSIPINQCMSRPIRHGRNYSCTKVKSKTDILSLYYINRVGFVNMGQNFGNSGFYHTTFIFIDQESLNNNYHLFKSYRCSLYLRKMNIISWLTRLTMKIWFCHLWTFSKDVQIL